MYADRPRRAPYVDWSLDRWKIGAVLALFVGLLAASLAAPAPPEVATRIPASGLMATLEPRPHDTEANEAPVVVPESEHPAPPLPIPLTLAGLGPNAVVPANSVRVLSGTALPRARVEVRAQTVGPAFAANPGPSGGSDAHLGTANVDGDGLWQIQLERPLQPGQHIISLRELDDRGQLRTVGDPVVVSVLAPGEQGPVALAIPQIRSPLPGARLASGPVSVTGVGLPGILVQLYLNGERVADGLVSAADEWALSPSHELDSGVYVARVLALNPQGEILAESAPVVFVVEAEPAQSSQPPYSLPDPSLPLTVSGLAFGDRRRTTLVVRGLATPHVAVAAWLDSTPMRQANAAADGTWLVALEKPEGFGSQDVVQIRSSLGEQVRTDLRRQAPVLDMAATSPRLVTPHAGEVLTSSRPLLAGVAQPGSVVAVLINAQVVAEVTADTQGQWAYQLAEPLPAGIVALAVGPGRQPRPERLASPVVVTVAPGL